MSNDTYTMAYPYVSLLDAVSLNNNECHLNFKNFKSVDRSTVDEIYLIIKDRPSLISKIIISNINKITDQDLAHMRAQFASIKEVKEIIFI